jgi:hypothetical protein
MCVKMAIYFDKLTWSTSVTVFYSGYWLVLLVLELLVVNGEW